jgi:hypothetical protein
MAEAMYRAAGPGAGGPGGPEAGGPTGDSTRAAKDVIDAEFEESK